MQTVYLLLFSLFVIGPQQSIQPLKIAVLCSANIDDNLKSELMNNIKATYYCSVTKIKAVTKWQEVAFYKPLIASLSYKGFIREVLQSLKHLHTLKVSTK